MTNIKLPCNKKQLRKSNINSLRIIKKPIFALLLITLFSFQISDQRSIYLLPRVSSGISAVDYNLDGDFDIVVNISQDGQTDWNGIYIMENDGCGYFNFYDSIYDTVGWFNTVGFLTGQSYPDVIYAARDSIRVLSTDGENYWINKYYVGSGVYDFDLGDINNDGLLDVLFCSSGYGFQNWGMLINEAEDNFNEPTYIESDFPISSIICNDMNNDGIDDILLIGSNSKVLLNNDTLFDEILLGVPASMAKVSDLDLNGENDIVAYAGLIGVGKFSIIINDSNTFDSVIEFFTPSLCSDYTITDVDNDNLPDLILQNHSESNPGYHIYYNVGDFQFRDSSFVSAEWMGEARRFMDCADMDGNGYDDIILSRQVYNTEIENSPLEIFFNDGNGNFVDAPVTIIQNQNSTLRTPDLICYPNPFTTQTKIEYTIEKKCMANLGVYSLKGQRIKTLINRTLQKGKQKTTWNGTDESGKEVIPGIYIICLKTERQTSSRRIIKTINY